MGIVMCSAECGCDLFLLSYDGPTEMTCGAVQFHGTALLLDSASSGRPVRAQTVDGRSLRLKGNNVFSTDSPAPARTLELH